MKFTHRHAYLITLSLKPYGSIAAVLFDTQAYREAQDAGLLDELGEATAKGKDAVAAWIETGTYDPSNGLVAE